MANDGVRIVIERQAGNRWTWRLTAYGDEYYDGHSEASPVKAVQAEESRLFAVEVARRMIRSDLAALVLAFVAVAIIGHLL
ncbi:MAG: hypothetical protein WAO13_25195 [Pseudolabrys sp.]|jgi:hypothetical protein